MTEASRKTRVAILISGSGTNMEALLEDMTDPAHPGEPALVLSNRDDAGGLAKAEARGVPTAVAPHKGRPRAAFEAALAAELARARAEIICLAGFMRILTPGFVQRRAGRILNIHPSLLPLFPGLDTHAQALAAGVAIHGCTVHEVTPQLDAGPILGQAALPVLPEDTPETLAARLLPLEHRLYPQVLRARLSGRSGWISILG
ncbi:MAG: phosphoribosylglycinamide formyltransferase [Pseudomonadota bacterium]